MLKTWSTRDNVPVEDFDVYGSEEDLKNSRNRGLNNADAQASVFRAIRGRPARGWDVGVPPRPPSTEPTARGDTSFAFYLPSSPVLFGSESISRRPSITAFASAVRPRRACSTATARPARVPRGQQGFSRTRRREKRTASRIQQLPAYFAQRVAAIEEPKQFEAKKLDVAARGVDGEGEGAMKTTAVSAVKNTAARRRATVDRASC